MEKHACYGFTKNCKLKRNPYFSCKTLRVSFNITIEYYKMNRYFCYLGKRSIICIFYIISKFCKLPYTFCFLRITSKTLVCSAIKISITLVWFCDLKKGLNSVRHIVLNFDIKFFILENSPKKLEIVHKSDFCVFFKLQQKKEQNCSILKKGPNPKFQEKK